MKRTLILISTLALSPLTYAADFAAVYQLAKENDSAFAEARAKFEAAQEKIPQGRAGLLPTVSLSGNTTYNREDVDNRTRRTQNDWGYNSHGYTLSLTKETIDRLVRNKPGNTLGFQRLVDLGAGDHTFESIILRHPDQFSPGVVRLAETIMQG